MRARIRSRLRRIKRSQFSRSACLSWITIIPKQTEELSLLTTIKALNRHERGPGRDTPKLTGLNVTHARRTAEAMAERVAVWQVSEYKLMDFHRPTNFPSASFLQLL